MTGIKIAYIAVSLLLGLVLVPLAPVAAQGVEEPLVEKVDEKSGAAQADPIGFATDQASDERLAEDAEWSIAYGCYVGYVATDEAGLPPPELEPCADFEEALGIAEEEEQAEEAVADAEDLQDGTEAELEAIVEDLEATLGRVLDQPLTAADEFVAFLERTLGGIERIVDGIGGFATETIDGIETGTGLLMKGAGYAVAAPVFGVYKAATAIFGFGTTVADGVASGTAAVTDAVAAAAGAVGDAVASGATGTRDGIGAMMDGIGATFERIGAAIADLVGGDAASTDRSAAPLDGLTGEKGRSTERLLDPIDGLIDRSTQG